MPRIYIAVLLAHYALCFKVNVTWSVFTYSCLTVKFSRETNRHSIAAVAWMNQHGTWSERGTGSKRTITHSYLMCLLTRKRTVTTRQMTSIRSNLQICLQLICTTANASVQSVTYQVALWRLKAITANKLLLLW